MNLISQNVFPFMFLAAALVVVSACGGPAANPVSSPIPGPPTYSIGGTVTGINPGQVVVLQDNNGDTLKLSANGSFAFATQIAAGGIYEVAVLTAPSGRLCEVSSGSGMVFGNVTDVAVACGNPYTVRGAVSGLAGQGLQLQVVTRTRSNGNGPQFRTLQALSIVSNGNFLFSETVALPAAGIFVHVTQQPSTPTQRCVLSSFTISDTRVVDVGVSCQEFSYVTNAASNTISVFSIDATTGALTPVGAPVPAGLSPDAIAAASDRTRLYVANGGSNTVSAFVVNPASGALTAVPGSPYAAGAKPGALLLTTGALYVANSGSSDLSVFGTYGDGTLMPPPAPYDSVPTGSRPSAIAASPDGNFMYVASAGEISAFITMDSVTSVKGSPFASGSKLSSLAFGGTDGQFLYAASASGSTAAIYGYQDSSLSFINPTPQSVAIDPTSGALTSLTGFPYALSSCTSLVTDQTRTYLYATAGSNLFGYLIDPATGALSSLAGFPVAVGATADALTVDGTNQFLYVRNASAGTITGFALNATTGAVTPIPGSPFAVGKSADFFATM